jgi:hypothetical protein
MIPTAPMASLTSPIRVLYDSAHDVALADDWCASFTAAPCTSDLVEDILAAYAYHLNVMPVDALMPDAGSLVRGSTSISQSSEMAQARLQSSSSTKVSSGSARSQSCTATRSRHSRTASTRRTARSCSQATPRQTTI